VKNNAVGQTGPFHCQNWEPSQPGSKKKTENKKKNKTKQKKTTQQSKGNFSIF